MSLNSSIRAIPFSGILALFYKISGIIIVSVIGSYYNIISWNPDICTSSQNAAICFSWKLYCSLFILIYRYTFSPRTIWLLVVHTVAILSITSINNTNQAVTGKGTVTSIRYRRQLRLKSWTITRFQRSIQNCFLSCRQCKITAYAANILLSVCQSDSDILLFTQCLGWQQAFKIQMKHLLVRPRLLHSNALCACLVIRHTQLVLIRSIRSYRSVRINMIDSCRCPHHIRLRHRGIHNIHGQVKACRKMMESEI